MLNQYKNNHHQKYQFFSKYIILSENHTIFQKFVIHILSTIWATQLNKTEEKRHRYAIIFRYKYYKTSTLLHIL